MESVCTTRQYILATDLDGTFLGGSDEEKAALYRKLSAERSNIVLIFVTGRGLESVLPLLADPFIPSPDYIIADIGATVVRGNDLTPVQPLQADIEKHWPGMIEVQNRLKDFPQLGLQEVPQERRCSYYVGPDSMTDEIEAVVKQMGCNHIYSCDRFFDVLPNGVDKGHTLLRLIETEKLAPRMVVVAGDTMNDLALFEADGVKGVVVGRAEQALVDAVHRKPGVFISDRPGAGGLLEGLVQFGVLNGETGQTTPNNTNGPATRELIIVYHRPPFEEQNGTNGETIRRPHKSPNGIVPTLLGLFADKHHGFWVSWSKQPSREPAGFDEHVYIDQEKFPGLTANRIALTDEDVRRFYEEFSKEAFWPIIFSFPDKAEFSERQWRHYCDVNRLFAERVARDAAPEATVWIHDYNLWMVPHYLRRLRSDLHISFFHHTAFPPSDVFNILPWSREIVTSLTQCNEIGFHIPRYGENFVDVVRSHMPAEIVERKPCAPRFLTFGCALGVSEMTTRLTVLERDISIVACPVGVDNKLIERTVTGEKCRTLIEETRGEVGDRMFVLSVERLDYVKGPIEKLLAFERLLDEHPELRGKVTLLNIITPAAQGMTVYDDIRVEVDQVTGRINGRFSKMNWTPVRYFFRAFPFHEILALYAAADVAWVTPLRDGLNLVAKEFIAAKAATNSPGVLVLSEFAGAAVELHGALLTNPYDVRDMARTLYQAVTLDENERRERLRRLIGIVQDNDVRQWSAVCLGEDS